MNKSFSAQFAPFIVLLVALLGVGVYVSNRDLDTTVKSADESLLPQSLTDAGTGLSLNYPADWTYISGQGNLVLFPTSDDTTSVSLTVLPTPIETLFANPPAEAAASDIEVYRARDGRVGYTYEVRGATRGGETGQSTKVIWLPTADGRTLEARLVAKVNELDDYTAILEGVALSSNIAVAQALELGDTYTSDTLGFSFQYPVGFQIDDAQPNSVSALDPNNQNTQIQFIIASPEDTILNVFSIQELLPEVSPNAILSSFVNTVTTANPNLRVIETVNAVGVSAEGLGELNGVTTLLSQATQDGSEVYFEISIYEVPNQARYLSIITVAAPADIITMRLTVYDMLVSMRFAEVAAPDATDEATEGDDTTETTDEGDTSETTEGDDTSSTDEGTDEAADDTTETTDEGDTSETTEGDDTSSTDEGTDEAADEGDTSETTEGDDTSSTDEGTDEAADDTTEATDEGDTSETTEGDDTSSTDEGTDEAADEGEATEAVAVEPLPLGDTTTNSMIGLTVAVPEGFTARNRVSFLFVENDSQVIRMTIDSADAVSRINLGLELETIPNNDIAVNLLTSYAQAVAADYDFVSGITVTDSGNRAYVDLTKGETKSRVYLQVLANGDVLFGEASAPLADFDTLAATFMAMTDTITVE